jgi:hypothetical protein
MICAILIAVEDTSINACLNLYRYRWLHIGMLVFVFYFLYKHKGIYIHKYTGCYICMYMLVLLTESLEEMISL